MERTTHAAGWDGAGHSQAQALVETLTPSYGGGENLAEVAHDARNMVTALGLYCDLLEEPGVLATPYLHYGSELRMVAAASRRLVEKLLTLDARHDATFPSGLREPVLREPVSRDGARRPVRATGDERFRQTKRWDLMPAVLIDSLAAELFANRNLLAALAGPSITLTVDTDSGALPVKLTGEDLTRVLVNLVKNSAEAMPAGGRIQLRLRQTLAQPGKPQLLSLTVDDNGPGIPPQALNEIFEAGFSTRSAASGNAGWPAAHRGLGLSISRSIIESAGGRIHASNRDPAGARLEIELPVRTP